VRDAIGKGEGERGEAAVSAGERDRDEPTRDGEQHDVAQDSALSQESAPPDYESATVPNFPRGAPVPASQWLTTRVDTTLDLPAKVAGTSTGIRKLPRWAAFLLVALALGLIIPAALYARGGPRPTSTVPAGCEVQDSPCQIARDYLLQYGAGHYDAMYQFISGASKKQFGASTILNGNYTDAHDYIVTRTSLILQQAQVYAMDITPGNQRITGATTAIVPAHVVMHTLRVGDVVQDLSVPMVREAGHWRVSWNPGLIFTQLNDPADPNYQRLVHLCSYDGHRGRILDRDGNVLAQDDNVYQIFVNPTQIKNQSGMDAVLAKDLGASTAFVDSLYAGAQRDALIRTITSQVYQQIAGDLTPFVGAGVDVQTTQGRVYPYGTDAAAVTGYVRAVSPQDLLDDTAHYYAASDVIGVAGVEAWAEDQLRPVKGGELDILPPGSGGDCSQALYTLGRRAPADGADVHTAISIALQQTAMSGMRTQQHPGGVVALDPVTGEVLALASYPIYDPNTLALPRGLTDTAAQALDNEQGYVNRAVSGAYPIGSSFKPVTLAAGLEHGATGTQTFTCTGSYQVPGESQPRSEIYDPHGHGTITPIQGLAVSCDTIFWDMALKLNTQDPNILPTMAKAFGYGQKTGIVGVPSSSENAGLVPDPTWLRQNHNAGWSPTDAANLAIGQGFFLATPLQVALATAAIANHGVRMLPRLVTSIAQGTVVVQGYDAKQVGTLPVSADHLAVIQAGMLDSTSQPQGTTYIIFQNFPVLVAGKTGTAESGHPEPHSIFTCYAPASPLSGASVTPKIAFGGILERGGLGGDHAAPIAKSMLALYLGVGQ
jgi:penicillin-binding protein 2